MKHFSHSNKTIFSKDWNGAIENNGIGKVLIEHVKAEHERLSLNVYEKNIKACGFYLREGFSVEERRLDENTMEFELIMEWRGVNDYHS